ncbi:MAG: hypothetical protein RR382_10495 [Tannerellaceae bacterium]
MKRYPHTAQLTIRAEPTYINGSRQPDNTSTITIVGRYDADGKTIKKNSKGNEVVIAGSFYVQGLLPLYDGEIVRIRIPAFGIDEPVFDIWRKSGFAFVSGSGKDIRQRFCADWYGGYAVCCPCGSDGGQGCNFGCLYTDGRMDQEAEPNLV